MKYIVLSFLVLSSTFAADLYCQGDKVDMELVVAESTGQAFEDYTNELYMNDCGIEGDICFVGKDVEAAKLLNTLNSAMYEYNDEVSFIGAYFKTESFDTVVLKYKETGIFNETLIYRCE